MAVERPHRVLMTADTVGGVWSHAIELSAALGRRGVAVSLATMGSPLSAAQRAQVQALPTVDVHESDFKLEWMHDPWDDVDAAGRWLCALDARLRPDVVHLNQFAFGALPFTAPTLLVGHSCVMSWWRAVHRERAPSTWERYRKVVRLGLEGADLVAAPSWTMLCALAREHGFAHSRLVLPNGRDPDVFRAGTKEPVILAAGRLWDAAKNLCALRSVATRLPWPVRLAGPLRPPRERSTSPQRISRADGLHWIGELSEAEMAVEFSHASIFVLPARYEPFGQSALEAGLSGCALVLGDIPSLREVWGDAAIYVHPEDQGSLHAVLTRLIAEPAFRLRMRRKALARARQFTHERMVKGYLTAYTMVRGSIATATRPPKSTTLEAH